MPDFDYTSCSDMKHSDTHDAMQLQTGFASCAQLYKEERLNPSDQNLFQVAI